ncbi:hypothetical protein [Flavobacterium sp.]|uniref:hypothetical protein n=1 Tax=Flavobacterium sp. TaxID=239 RepID=UPI002621CF94|nr:hypothetical protein [Flavobacterium sp.]
MMTTPYTVNPPGQKITIISVRPAGKINFENKCPDIPLSPLVEATYFTESDEMRISAVVFLDAAIVSPSFEVFQECQPYVEGEPPVKFYVCYDHKRTMATEFNAYQVNFSLDPAAIHGIEVNKINEIETFLWDTDPKASRGTVTNVQRN